MSRPPPRLAFLLASLLLIAAALGSWARAALAGDCFEVISGENAQKLFEALKKAKPDDGCALESVRTEASQMTIVYRKAGAFQEGILVAPSSCVKVPTTRGLVLSTVVPTSTAKACPAASEALATIVASDTFGGLVKVEAALPVSDVEGKPLEKPLWVRARPYVVRGLAAALAAAVVVALRRVWKRRNGGAWAARKAAGVGAVVRAGGGRAWRWLTQRTPRNPHRAGWGAAIVLGPHLALGTWLLVVPDHLAFTAAQVITLAHVGLAALTFPIAGGWVVWHVRGLRAARARSSGSHRAVRWALATAAVLATVTGALAIRGGDIAPTATLHAACGVAVGVPLAVHLWQSAKKGWAGFAAGLLVASTAGAWAAKRWLPPAPVEAVVPAFSYETKPVGLYEPAANCAECHAQDYEDWSHSVHARTMQLPAVQEAMERASDLLGENLAHIGETLAEKDTDRPVSAALIFGACGSCHAPVSFYGDGKPNLTKPTGTVAEGTGCSFCHTLREVKQTSAPLAYDEGGLAPPVTMGNPERVPHTPPGTIPAGGPGGPGGGARPGGARPTPGEISRADIFAAMARAPLFVSAPETVRRYLGQGSSNPVARRISSWLIRWRPQVHARDYHSPVLDDSRVCLPCHSLGMDSPDVPHMTYYGWEHSSFNTGDPKTTVECQDCHMVRHVTGGQVNEWARQVPWGPLRPRARSHLMLGGNVAAARVLGDARLAAEEHELNLGAVSVGVVRVARAGEAVKVTVSVRNERVGHFFPALETKLRYGWVELRALDAAGKELARTPPPRDSDDFGCASPLIMASVVDPKPDNQRLVAARGARELTGLLRVPAGAEVDRIVADLHDSVDPQPIATASWSARGEP